MNEVKVLNFSKLSDCEIIVMQCLWEAGTDISSMDVRERIRQKYGREYGRSTVTTFLNNLKKKGMVSSYQVGLVVYYHPEVEEGAFQAEQTRTFCQQLFGGSLKKMIAGLGEGGGLSEEERKEIQEIIDHGDC